MEKKNEEYLKNLKSHNFKMLCDLAELSEDEMKTSDCDLASYALEKVLKYGNCCDATEAIKSYTAYAIAQQLLHVCDTETSKVITNLQTLHTATIK